MAKKGNRNKKIGRDFEYKTIKYLRKHGYYCLRAYASLGLYDVLAIPPVNSLNPHFHNYPLLIQCKRNGYVKPEELEKLKLHSPKWQGWALIAFNVEGKGRPQFRDLKGEIIISI